MKRKSGNNTTASKQLWLSQFPCIKSEPIWLPLNIVDGSLQKCNEYIKREKINEKGRNMWVTLMIQLFATIFSHLTCLLKANKQTITTSFFEFMQSSSMFIFFARRHETHIQYEANFFSRICAFTITKWICV